MSHHLGQKGRDEGFTLFELLIVIIILAILAGIVVFATGSTRNNSLAASCSADAKAFGSALEEYKALVGAFPGATTLQVSQPSPQPLPGYGQTWGFHAVPAFQLPGTYGLLGNPSSPSGKWTAPNGQSVGQLMRQLPQTQHYQIVTDGQGGVFVYPPGSTPNIGAAAMDVQTVAGWNGDDIPNTNTPDTTKLDFETTPSVCSDPNVVS
jgi:general secretion pathway protein G